MFTNLRLKSALKKLKSNDWRLRVEAVKSLGKLKDQRVLEPLSQVLGDREANVGCAAAEVLGRIRDPQRLERLVAAFRVTDESSVGQEGRIGDGTDEE
jgi:HEAT repeat protein